MPEVLRMYSNGEHIGSGCQGSVYKTERKADQKKCIVKVMTVKEEEGMTRALNEVKFLNRIVGEEHLAQIVDSCEEKILQKYHIF